jgi:regulator of PEP synthase PpsR (kinase-PPPase family)
MRKAQIVVLGVSRTSKTSVSYQLAERGYLVANCPIVPAMPLPPAVDEVDPRRVFVLMMDAASLARARRPRLQYLGRGQEGYADVEQAESELRHALALLRAHSGWTRIDVTNQPTEETAAMILQAFADRFPGEVL